MESQYIDICYHSGQFWGATIVRRAQGSSCASIRERMSNWEHNPLRELCLAVSTKHALLECIVRRINNHLSRLDAELHDGEKLARCLDSGSCFGLSNNDLAFEILVDVDSFVFECRSAYEIMGKYLRGFFEEILEEMLEEENLLNALGRRAVDTQWTGKLKESRKLFFHETAPWIAILVKARSPLTWELLICKQDAKNFSNPNDFIRFEELRKIYSGFEDSLPIIESWVEMQIEAHESASSNARKTSDP